MCLIVLAWKVHPRYSLILGANRDEFHGRRSAPLNYWDDNANVLGGRDLEKGGSWLAANTDGKWAAITNFRDGRQSPAAAPSRGHLIRNYVASELAANEYMSEIETTLPDYAGCNLLVAQSGQLYYASNRHNSGSGTRVEPVTPGVHGLSNHLLDTPWPKVQRTKQRLNVLLDSDTETIKQDLFALLADRREADDTELPSTGVPLARERELSPPFIVAGEYGTRASTVLLIGNDGSVQMFERGFGADGEQLWQNNFAFDARQTISQ